MFGVSKPKTENSLFQDSRSEKTERKPQSYPNRRSKNKSNQLRVSWFMYYCHNKYNESQTQWKGNHSSQEQGNRTESPLSRSS